MPTRKAQWYDYLTLAAFGVLSFGFGAANVSDGMKHWTLVDSGLAAAMTYFLFDQIRTIVRKDKRRIVLENNYSFELTDDGIARTVGGKRSTTGWKLVGSAHRIGGFVFIIGLNEMQPRLIVPESCAPGLWQALEDRLISKRGLILGPHPRTFIINSAY